MKKCFIVFLPALVLSINSFHLQAQKKIEEIKITGVSGKATGGENETLAQVEQRAVNEAKTEAVKQAGIEENIASYTDFFQKEENNQYADLFTSDFLSDIRGSVKDIEIVKTYKSFNEFGLPQIEVLINCIVVKYLTEKDLAFDAWIEGVGMFYPSGSDLLFKIKSSKDTYLKIFIFGESDAFQLFPNEQESSFLLKANQMYSFPSETMEYELYTNKKSEVHRMVMVFMKDDIPYTNDIEYKKIIDWIFSIPPDMRIIKTKTFSVVQEKKITE